MVRVRRESITLARMAAGALAVARPPLERRAVHITVTLRMRVVAIRAPHRPIRRAVAVALGLLVSERADASIWVERSVPKLGKAERVVVVERHSGEVAGREVVFERVASEAQRQPRARLPPRNAVRRLL